MKKTITTLLFDFDGTVFDTVEGITKSIQYALRKHGRDAELEELRCFAGPPLVDKFMEVYEVSKYMSRAPSRGSASFWRRSARRERRRPLRPPNRRRLPSCCFSAPGSGISLMWWSEAEAA